MPRSANTFRTSSSAPGSSRTVNAKDNLLAGASRRTRADDGQAHSFHRGIDCAAPHDREARVGCDRLERDRGRGAVLARELASGHRRAGVDPRSTRPEFIDDMTAARQVARRRVHVFDLRSISRAVGDDEIQRELDDLHDAQVGGHERRQSRLHRALRGGFERCNRELGATTGHGVEGLGGGPRGGHSEHGSEAPARRRVRRTAVFADEDDLDGKLDRQALGEHRSEDPPKRIRGHVARRVDDELVERRAIAQRQHRRLIAPQFADSTCRARPLVQKSDEARIDLRQLLPQFVDFELRFGHLRKLASGEDAVTSSPRRVALRCSA